ncbi:hypothetical protein CVT24_002482 [Panaeolus cyanescens]|uniref:F-box domain-containing protein n=1 Tax=Panaeolus cyanescens TaxID=181874 RepID=A0A409YTS5_9AGAR|nr:hypothetical protein CVT24_002482 [Panaeolus cyanescens]
MPFHDLPPDVYFTICSFLDALDILALGQTCTILRSATEERSVWLTALNHAMSQNQIFAGTYSGHLALDLETLKDAATAPSRVLNKLLQGGPTDLPERNPPVLKYKKKHVISTADLDRDPDDAEGDDEVPESGGSVAEISIMRFMMEDQPPIVKCQTTKLEVARASDPEYFTVVGDLFIYTYIPPGQAFVTFIVNVWNFMEDTFASWSTPFDFFLELFYDDGHVVMIEQNSFRGWKIPPLHPRRGQGPIPVQTIPETFKIPIHANPTFTPRIECERAYDWYNTHRPLQAFTFKDSDTEPNAHVWTTYSVQTTHPQSTSATDNPPLHHKTISAHPLKSRFPRAGHMDTIVSNPLFLCNDAIVRLFANRGRPYAAVGLPHTGSQDDSGPLPEVMVELEMLQELSLCASLYSRVHFAFDVFSGRFAYISQPSHQIVVLDYLRHPGAVPDPRPSPQPETADTATPNLAEVESTTIAEQVAEPEDTQ